MPNPSLASFHATLLVIDDDPACLRLAEAIGHQAGFARVLTAERPFRGIELFRDEGPDALMLDLCMPELSGFEVMRLLRLELADGVLPVVVATALDDPDTEARALALGALDVVGKPYSSRDLALRLRNVAMIGSLQRRLRARGRDLEAQVAARTARLEAAVAMLKVAEARLVQEIAGGKKSSARRRDHLSRELRTALKAMVGYAGVLQQQTFGPLGHPRYRAYADDLAATASSTIELVEQELDAAEAAPAPAVTLV